MKTKLIKNLDSLMIFTGANANVNAQALEDRKYDIFSDDYIGTLKLNKDYDSVFSNTQSEIFIETTPKYKSIKDVTEIAYSYIINKSVSKPTDTTQMYIDEYYDINFKYDYENGLNCDIDNAKIIPLSDLMLYFTSLNNSLFNKQKYYSKHKEIESLSNVGVKYYWRPVGSYFTIYDETTYSDIKHENGNDFISYSLKSINVQDVVWDDIQNKYVEQYDEKIVTNEDGTISTELVPKTSKKQILEYENSFSEIFSSKLENAVERFKERHNPDMLCYYLYDLNTTFKTIVNTYSFGQTYLNVNLNYEGEFNNWFDNRITFNIESPETKELIKVTPGSDYWFNLAYEGNRLMESDVKTSDELYLTIPEIKDYQNLSILSPYKIKELDFSNIANALVGTLDISSNYDKKISSKDYVNTNWINERGSMLENLVIGKEGVQCKLTNIVGLECLSNLKKLDLRGCDNLVSDPNINSLKYLEEIYIKSSNISVFNPFDGVNIKVAQLPDSLTSIILDNVSFENENALDYSTNSTLTTLELNNVKGIDTMSFVSKWIDNLKNENLLDSGLVNYVNLNGIDWNYVDPQLLKDLKVIELNEFSGNINVWGPGVYQDIYRKDYRDLVDLYGTNSVLLPGEDSSDNLHINVKLGNNAFNVKLQIIERYIETRYEENSDGYIETIEEVKEKEHNKFVFTINVLNTSTGNSFLDLVDSNPDNVFDRIEKIDFVNSNKINIGWALELTKPLILPEKSESLEYVSIGDVLLFNKQTLIIVTKNTKNVNQNFTKIGSITNVDLMYDLLNDTFDLDYLYSLSYMEDEIVIPSVNDDNYVDIEYEQLNYIDVEYEQNNYIDVVYD